MSGAGSQTRWPCSASTAAARFEDLDRVGQEQSGLVGCGRQPVEAGRPRAEFHALLEVDAPDAPRPRQADRLPISTLSPPLLPAPVAPPNRTWRRRNEHPARFRVLERAELDGLGDGGRTGRATESRPRAGRCPARAARTGWRGRRGWGRRGRRRGRCRARIRSRGSSRSRRGWSGRGPGRSRARQPQRSTMADMTCDPASPRPERYPARIRGSVQAGPWPGADGWPTREWRRLAPR